MTSAQRLPATPCTCPKHRRGGATVFGEHEFALDYEQAQTVGGDLFDAWRWLCACGSRGRWQVQSDNAAYHAWLRHVESAPPQEQG